LHGFALQRKPITELKGTTVITHHFEAVLEVRAGLQPAFGIDFAASWLSSQHVSSGSSFRILKESVDPVGP
jgi:hypothetical protein